MYFHKIGVILGDREGIAWHSYIESVIPGKGKCLIGNLTSYDLAKQYIQQFDQEENTLHKGRR